METPLNSDSKVGLPFPTKRQKIIISVLVSLHLLAVFIEPMQFFTRSQRGASEAVEPVRNVLAPYTTLAYLNHGYFFFAPEPGPSHLLACELEYDNGESATLRFPDKEAQWPRLLYHRHFMLAEFLHLLHVPPADPGVAQSDPEAFGRWQEDRNRFEMIRSAMETHLIARYGGKSVRIDRVEHQLPNSVDVLEKGRALDDPTLYEVLPDGPVAQPAEVSRPPLDSGTMGLSPYRGRELAGEEVSP